MIFNKSFHSWGVYSAVWLTDTFTTSDIAQIYDKKCVASNWTPCKLLWCLSVTYAGFLCVLRFSPQPIKLPTGYNGHIDDKYPKPYIHPWIMLTRKTMYDILCFLTISFISKGVNSSVCLDGTFTTTVISQVYDNQTKGILHCNYYVGYTALVLIKILLLNVL